MARTDLTVQRIDRDGLDVQFTAANVDGHMFRYGGGKRAVMVVNASAAPVDVMIPSVATVDGLAVAARQVTVAAGATALVRESSAAVHATGADAGKVYVDLSATATVDVAVVELD